MRIARVQVALAAAATVMALVAAACGGSSGGGPTAPTPPSTDPGNTPAATLASLQSQIFTPRCVGCHGGGAPEAGLNLSSGSAFAALVNVPSSQRGGAVRVIPGNPDASYLVQKIRGDAGIVGLRMPADGPPFLTEAQITLIRQWISEGARNN